MSVVVTVLLAAAAVILGVSGLVAVERIATGPSNLDRSISADLLVAVVIGTIGVWSVWQRQDTWMVMILVLSMLGFTGAVSVARMVGERVVVRRAQARKKEESR